MVSIGIDLGTSNSLIGFWDGEKSVLIPNQYGKLLTPSIVGLDENGEILVGEVAKERLITHPAKTVSTFKRFMGTDKRYKLGNMEVSPVELSAFVLKSLLKNAEDYLGEPCEEAIISVPAYFNNLQREATIEAAKLAGIKVKQLISEPTAAAVAYGLHKDIDQTILVVDLGGGTFDVSLLDCFEGIMQVEAISGDNYLGGDDFTKVLVLDFLQEKQLADEVLSFEEHSLLYKKMEELKLRLTKEQELTISIGLNGETYTYSMTQENYGVLCDSLLKRLRNPIVRVLNDGKLKIESIDRVILVGGATKSPIIRNYFARLLKQMPYTLLEPDETVAYGVGIQASLKENQILKEEMILTDVSGHSLGVESSRETEEGYIHDVYVPIIERNTTIPVSKERTFYSLFDNQTEIRFSIFQGEQLRASENLKIGEITIEIPPAASGYPVTCRFTYDVNGILEVIVEDKKSGVFKRLVIEENPGSLTKEQIEASLEKLEKLKVHPKDRAENRLILARLERLYTEITGEKRQQIQSLALDFQQILDKQDEKLVKQKLKEYNQLLNRLESELLL